MLFICYVINDLWLILLGKKEEDNDLCFYCIIFIRNIEYVMCYLKVSIFGKSCCFGVMYLFNIF